MLIELTNLCQPIETNLERTKIETLVTVHVHQRDIAVELKCQNVFDFDWQKQIVFKRKMIIRMCILCCG